MYIPNITNSFFVKAADGLHLADRPLPNAPDGAYDFEALPTGSEPTPTHSYLSTTTTSSVHRVADAFQHVLTSRATGKTVIAHPRQAAHAAADAILHKHALDDRKGTFSTALSAITRLPPGPLQDNLNNKAIELLYDTLPHPPATYIGERSAFRSADGSGNNPSFPELGQSGRPYARTVQAKHPLPANTLPDPGLVFDTLLRAKDWKPHPNSNSTLTFAFALIVTHSLFRSDYRNNMDHNKTTSYLDLSPLYGYNQETQDAVRDKSHGRGLLYPDTFSEDRLTLTPAAVSALLVIFSRNHNYIATMLLKINERGRWEDPPPVDQDKRKQQDEEIFQTARLVNCGHFMAMIFGDYVSGFLGLPREGSSWSMQPFDPITKDNGEPLYRGEGNHVSAEFNLLYRWHAVLGQEDLDWAKEAFDSVTEGDSTETMKPKAVLEHAIKYISGVEKEPPNKRTFGGLSRQENGTFPDDGLAKILHDATQQPAGAFRARGTHAIFRPIEMLGMEQGRKWGVCTMNEFREYLGLKRFETFEEWAGAREKEYYDEDGLTPEERKAELEVAKEVAEAARKLYGHIDNLELYPGLYAEECMAVGPGSGICAGYTLLRAILGDAIALVRGDRFFTIDYTPGNLTSWGYQDCVRDPNNGAFGAALPKLLLRHLPRHYPANNVYGLFPFITPTAMHTNLTNLGKVDQYDFARPTPGPVPKVVDTLTGIHHVFDDAKTYKVIYGPDLRMLTRGWGFMLSFDDDEQTHGGGGGKAMHDSDKAMCMHALWPDKDTFNAHVEWYGKTTKQLIDEKSYQYEGMKGRFVDIVEVINFAGAHWCAEKLVGIPLKTASNPMGLFTEFEVYEMFVLLFTCVFINTQPEHGWSLRYNASLAGKIVNGMIEQSLLEVAPWLSKSATGLPKSPTKGSFTKPTSVSDDGKDWRGFLSRLAGSGQSLDALVANVDSLATGSSVNFTMQAVGVVDFYLADERTAERQKIIELCHSSNPDDHELLKGYIREGMRFNPQTPGLFRSVAKKDVIPLGNGKNDVVVDKGDILWNSFKNAHMNPNDFPDPHTIDPRRPKDSYWLQSAGYHVCPAVDFSCEAMAAIVKTVFTLPGLQRAPGDMGKLAGFTLDTLGTATNIYLTNTGNFGPWPGSMHIVYDG